MAKDDDGFIRLLASMRPKLHRYCARMIGSAVDGEDVAQDVLLKASNVRSRGDEIEHLEPWLFKVAHNASLDFLRARARQSTIPLTEELTQLAETAGPSDAAAVGFRAFLELPVLQRCTVVLKDVLGYTIEEIAEIAGCSVPAAKSALQRGRNRLRELARREDEEVRLPNLVGEERERLTSYVAFFQTGDFDAIRRMLAEEVRLDLVGRLQLQGRERIEPYFSRYREAGHWLYAPGAVDGRLVMLVYNGAKPSDRPAHFVVLDWRANAITHIRDFLYAPYAMEAADWVCFEQSIRQQHV